MSTTELTRAGVLARVKAATLTLRAAATLMGVSYRQAKRLAARYRRQGARGLRHGNAGRVSNRAISARRRKRVLGLIQEKYGGGPTSALGRHSRRSIWRVKTTSAWITRRCGAGCWRRGCGVARASAVRTGAGGSACRILASCCSSMGVCMRGSRGAARRVVC
jgi:transposase